MPLVRISLVRGKSPEHIRAISDGIQRGLVGALEAPEDDRFQTVQQHERGDFIYSPNYLGIHRTDDLVVIQIVASAWRDTPQKKTIYKAITDNLVGTRACAPRMCSSSFRRMAETTGASAMVWLLTSPTPWPDPLGAIGSLSRK